MLLNAVHHSRVVSWKFGGTFDGCTFDTILIGQMINLIKLDPMLAFKSCEFIFVLS